MFNIELKYLTALGKAHPTVMAERTHMYMSRLHYTHCMIIPISVRLVEKKKKEK